MLIFNKREFITTETLLRAIAKPANSGFKNNPNFIKTPAAIGIHKLL
jgi:hypothetical protein